MSAPTPILRTISDSKTKTVRHVSIPAGGDADVAETIVIDTSALTGGATGTTHSISRLQWSLSGFAVNLFFDATADVHAATMAPGTGTLDFNSMAGGLTNNAGTGITGDITFNTTGIAAADDENDDNIGFFIIETHKVV